MPALPGAARGRHGRLVLRTLCLAAGETRGSPASPGARRRVGSWPRGQGLLLFPAGPARAPGDAHLGGERAVLCPLCLWAGHCFLGHREVTNRACDFSLSQRMGLYIRYLAEQGQCVQTEVRALWLVARILRTLLLQEGARAQVCSHLSRSTPCVSGLSPVASWCSDAAVLVPAPCTKRSLAAIKCQSPARRSSTRGRGRGPAGEQRPQGAPRARPLSPPRRLRFLAALCIPSTSAIDMGLEPSHAFLRLGQGLCGPAFQGESPLPLCSRWQKGPLCASGSVLPRGRIGTEQPQLGRKWRGGGRGGP